MKGFVVGLKLFLAFSFSLYLVSATARPIARWIDSILPKNMVSMPYGIKSVRYFYLVILFIVYIGLCCLVLFGLI